MSDKKKVVVEEEATTETESMTMDDLLFDSTAPIMTMKNCSKLVHTLVIRPKDGTQK